MNVGEYNKLQFAIFSISDEMQDWGNYAQFAGFLATHEKHLNEVNFLDNGLFRGKNPLYWIDKYISDYYADSPEIGLLSMQGYCEEMQDTKEFGVRFLNYLNEFGGKTFVQYQNALIFNSEYLDTL